MYVSAPGCISGRCDAIRNRDYRQIAIEFSGFVHFAEHPNAPFVRLNDLSGNRKPKSSTVALQFLRPVEFVEDLGLLNLGETGTTVYHTESNQLPVPSTRSNNHIGLRKAIFQCVRDEIGEDQTHPI